MFAVNDYVVCKKDGVCRIADIRPVSGRETKADLPFYILEPFLHPGDTVSLPVGSDLIARRIMTREEATEILDRVPYIRTIQAPREKIRNEFYAEAMDSFECIEWIKIIKTVYVRKKDGLLSDTELAYEAAAQKYFYSELAVVLGIPYDAVEKYIVRYVKNSFK